MTEQHERDSKELRRLCESRDRALRERDSYKAEIAGLEASCATLSRLVDKCLADGERLEWVLRRCSGNWLRTYLGVANDTGNIEELCVLIDANRGALQSEPTLYAADHADPLPGMSEMNRLVAYCAASKLRGLGYEWDGNDWSAKSQGEKK